MAKISVIIPALNEAESIGKVVVDVPIDVVNEIIVVDNGSTDNTVQIAHAAGAKVVREPQRGYGAACLRGVAALERPDIVVFLDGDYSDYPQEIRRLVKPILCGEADLVIGSRSLGGAEKGSMTPQQIFGNRLATTLIRWLWGYRYSDLGPFRAIRYSALKRLNMRDRGFGWTVEMQVNAVSAGLKTCEIPVRYRRRIGRSKISGTLRGAMAAGFKIIYTIFKHKLLESYRKWSVVHRPSSIGR